MAKEKNLTEETTEVVTEKVTEPTEPEETEAPEDVAGEEIREETEENGSKDLVAVYPILFQSHQYKVSDTLPTNYPDMVDAWIEAGSAVWRMAETVAPKAKSVTAEPGQSGVAVASEAEDGDNLVGKVPKTTGRKKK